MYELDDEPDDGDDGGMSEQPINDDDADVDEDEDDDEGEDEDVVARIRGPVARSGDTIHANLATGGA